MSGVGRGGGHLTFDVLGRKLEKKIVKKERTEVSKESISKNTLSCSRCSRGWERSRGLTWFRNGTEEFILSRAGAGAGELGVPRVEGNLPELPLLESRKAM